MTWRCVGVGGNEFNFHSFPPCRRVADMVEGFPGTCSESPALMRLRGEAMQMPACAPATQLSNTNRLELPQAREMRTPEIPVLRDFARVGCQLDWLQSAI
jgi:hypothetical protein